MTTTAPAKPYQGRRRAQPRPLPTLLVHLALWLGVLSIWAPAPWMAWTLRLLGLGLGLAYFVQHFRRASWTVDQAIQAELDR